MASSFRHLAPIVAALALSFTTGCAESSAGVAEPLTGYDAGTPIAKSAPRSAVPCAEGKKRACHVELGKNGDVADCFVGFEICSDGEWGPCGEADDAGDTGAGGSEAPR